MLTFRLTAEEYESLRAACLAQGARCLSDFARRAVLESVKARSAPEHDLLSRLASLEEKVTVLSGNVSEALALLQQSSARRTKGTLVRHPL